MKSAMFVKAAAVAVVIALAGCTDLKPIQAQIDDLKTQVAKLQTGVDAANAAAAQASQAASAASATGTAAGAAAAAAQSTANQALAAAQAAQAAVDATNEKIDRMFKRSISK
jgi:hypothetical protein